MLEASQWWSEGEREAYQLDRLNRILAWAAIRVPYYRKLNVEDLLPLRSLEDLSSWPIVDRATVAAQPEAFTAAGLNPLRVRRGTTTGSSGKPLTVSWEWPSAVLWEQAFAERAFRWAGLKPGFRRAVLRGNLIHGPQGTESRFYQIVPHRRSLVLSTFQLDFENVGEYLDLLNSFGAQALQAYPSAAARLARLASEKGLTVPSLSAVLTSSEMLTPSQKDTIESGLGAPVYDLYGHAERAAAAANCQVREGYHIFEEYGLVEILDDNGILVPPGADGEIVATGFLNRAMPFIRYRTGDQATRSARRCRCGRTLTMLERLVGRDADYLIDRHGNKISVRLGLGGDELDGIAELCFVQTEAGSADLLYVGTSDDAREAHLRSTLDQRLGKNIEVNLKRVSRLPFGSGGKTQLVSRSLGGCPQ